MGQLLDQLTGAAASRGSGWWRIALHPGPRARRLALRVACLAVSALAVGAAFSRPGGAAIEGRCVERVTGGAASMDELIDRFLMALRAGDRQGLEALRLTRDEYVGLVMPGHVTPGAPPQRLGSEAADYYFGVMDAKSHYFREMLIARFAGRTLELRARRFEKGIAEYAGHRVYKRAELALRNPAGEAVELRTGSVVERDGRFKFASFVQD